MKKNQQSIDGFKPRRRTTQSVEKGNLNAPKQNSAAVSSRHKKVEKNLQRMENRRSIKPVENPYTNLNDAIANLEIEDDFQADTPVSSKNRANKKELKLRKKLEKINQKRTRKGRKPLSLQQLKRKRKIGRIFGLIFLALVLFGGWKIYDYLQRSGIANGNLLDILSSKGKLKTDEQGRTNILIFGTSPEGWDGQELADSIMVISANQETGKTYTISLPRDLYVRHTCSSWLGTTAGKLNETYGCGYYDALNSGSSKEDAEKAGQNALAQTAKEVLGLDIQYVVHGNWQVVIDSVNAVGGIDVLVEAYDGASRVYDVATKIDYQSGKTYHMDGETALAFSRARGSEGGIGLSNSNFDRERNQQKVIKATLSKVNEQKFSPAALIGIITSLGNNIKTSFEYSELQTAANLAEKFNGNSMTSIPLINDEDSSKSYFTTGSIGAISAVIPKAGTYDYSDIRAHIKKTTLSDEVSQENAKIVVLNGTSISGLAAEQKDILEDEGYNVTKIDSAPTSDYEVDEIYAVNSNKSATITKLEKKYGVKAQNSLPNRLSEYAEDADIIIVLGRK
ncbi:MAG: LCP family protein [bacterium]|nr:LCP family protein [bacterium]